MRLDDVETPAAPAADQVQVRVLWCGICGTDVEEYMHGPLFIPIEPHPLTGKKAPLTLGHEMSGEIVAIGKDVKDLRVGEVVALSPTMWCGACRWCRSGRVNLCERTADLGLAADGGLAEYCNAPAYLARPLPAASADDGALAEPLAVALRGLRRGRFEPSDRVAVFGAGAVGLLTLQAAHSLGAKAVSVVEPISARRRVADDLGATHTLAPDEIGDMRFDLVVECSGAASAIMASISAAGRGGRVVLVGVCDESVPIDPLTIMAEEKEVLGSLGFVFQEDYVEAVDLIASGRVSIDPIVSDRLPISRALRDGLIELAEHPERHMKILVSPTDA